MRVALILSGKFRNSFKEYASIKKNLIDKYDVDVFISYGYTLNNIDCVPNDLIKLYNPVSFEFFEYPNEIYTNINSVSKYEKAIESNTTSIYMMWYGINKVNELKTAYEIANGFEYDVVIKSRFDIEFKNTVLLKKLDNSIFIPIGSDHRGGYNDLVAYGSSNTMNYYCSTYTHITQYIEDGCVIHPERILKHHLDKNEFIFYRTHIPMMLRGIPVNEVDYVMNF
jgi:hypothetical protein